jgi:hypothetical protein
MNKLLQLLRKILLIGNGMVFLWFAILTLVNIEASANSYALMMDGVDGHNEFRAVFMGFWVGLSLLFFQSARHYRLAVLGDVAFMLILFQSLARLYSFAVDGIPSVQFILYFILELTTSVVGLLIRPHKVSSPS